jgi:aminoglycoside phosphotransferase (APT) family kinase protein
VPDIRIVRYEPEEHCLARFALSSAGGEVAIFGKSYATESWRDARDTLDAMWRRGCDDPQAFIVGRLLGSSAVLRVVWQAEVHGVPLVERVVGSDGTATLEAVAVALGRLHAGAPIARKRRSLGETLDVARKWRKKLVQAEVSLAPAIDAVLFQLENRALRPRRLVTIHGDFHLDQMMWSEGRIALFDYDNFSIDSPARDVGDFVSQLLCREDRQANWPLLAARFVDCYRARCGEALSDQELEWYLQLMLLRKAYSFFVRQRDGWRQRSLRALIAAQAGLSVLPRTADAEVC